MGEQRKHKKKLNDQISVEKIAAFFIFDGVNQLHSTHLHLDKFKKLPFQQQQQYRLTCSEYRFYLIYWLNCFFPPPPLPYICKKIKIESPGRLRGKIIRQI